MKKRIVSILIIMFLFIPFVNASTVYLGNYNSVRNTANEQIKLFSNYNKYIVTPSLLTVPYKYTSSGVSVDSNFISGGLLNYYEYQISGKELSYLFDAQEYYTMTENGSNKYQISATNEVVSPDILSGARPTEYILPKTKVIGSGTYENPWMFSTVTYLANITIINGTSTETQLEMEEGESKTITITPSSKSGYVSSSCTNGVSSTYANKKFTINAINSDTECTITYTTVNSTFSYVNNTQTFTIPATGYYYIQAYGAKGNGNGGNGALAQGERFFNKGDVLSINTGGVDGTNGGGAGYCGTDGAAGCNGGGSSTIKLGSTIIIAAAGGGGGSGGTAGGYGTGAGGASVGSTAGVAGSNGGGGGSSATYKYECNCSSCYYGSNTCQGGNVNYNCNSCYYGSPSACQGSNTIYYRYYNGCSSYKSTPWYPNSPSCDNYYASRTDVYSGYSDCKQSHANAYHGSAYQCGNKTWYHFVYGSNYGKQTEYCCQYYFYKYSGGTSFYVNGYSQSGYFINHPGGCYVPSGDLQSIYNSCAYTTNTCSYGCDSYYSSCATGSNTCSYGCGSCSTQYKPGNGGTNIFNSSVTSQSSSSGANTTNGKVVIYYNRES